MQKSVLGFCAFPLSAKLDANARLEQFCLALERACIRTVESGAMPKDLAICVKGAENVTVCLSASVVLLEC